MTPRRVYSLFEAMTVVGRAARRGKPRAYIWVATAKGDAKILRPQLQLDGLSGDIMVNVAPRYQVRLMAPLAVQPPPAQSRP